MERLWTIACVGLLLACNEPAAPEPTEPAVEPATEAQKAPEAPPTDTTAEAPEATAEGQGAKEGCTYAYQAAETKLVWTAFKLSEKVGVPGTFDKITVTGTAEASDPAAVFAGARFDIDTGSVNSGNPERDPKLVAAFFGTLQAGEKISGAVKSIGEGKGTIDLTLGGVTRPVELKYVFADGTLTATGKIDTVDFGGGAAIAALNKVCEAQHTGKDGQSKLWSEVELKVESKLAQKCP